MTSLVNIFGNVLITPVSLVHSSYLNSIGPACNLTLYRFKMQSNPREVGSQLENFAAIPFLEAYGSIDVSI